MNIKQKLKGKNGVFGSTERRFVHIEHMKVPGPGEYTTQDPYSQNHRA